MMTYSTYTWNLVWALRSESPASGKTPATFIDSIHLNNRQGRNKESRNKIKLQTSCIILPWSKYEESRAWNLGLRVVDLEPSPKSDSAKINMV